MAKFLTGNELNLELELLFENAQSSIILISPFIKLHARYESVLKSKLANPNLSITVVFGKNEENLSRSMSEIDFNFFKQFPNIEIRFEKRLHAKYYANENAAVLTSMNLYSFSQDNNIEAGILTEKKGLISGDVIDANAWNYFDRVIEQSVLLFRKVPEFETSMLGLSKKYKGSITEVDELTSFFSGKSIKPFDVKKAVQKIEVKRRHGYCIRTGEPIPFNVDRPLSAVAFQTWNNFKDHNFPERFCHFSGEKSNGETSFGKPILRKNWNEAKKEFNL